ncbi:hypothetical protein ACA910_001005 [Epithemia clementina (nom. ined.)]
MIWKVVLFSILEASTAIRRTDRRRLDFDTGYSSQRRNSTLTSQRSTARVTVEIPSSPDGHLVTDLLPLTKDGEELTVRHWAGHLPASGDNHKYFFYWLFEPETVDEHTPILIWLNGGPACSSMDGLFLENGPLQWTLVDGKYMLQKNPYSWHNAPAYTLYIDQPVGTGLSFTTNKGYPKNDEEVNTDFYYFLTSFFDLHADKFLKDGSVNRKVFFSGESHAGHYIPSMMNYILQKNRIGSYPFIPLAGAAIGNGYFDPIYQYAAAEAAYGHGLLDRAQLNSFAAAEQKCRSILQQGKATPDVCYSLLDDILDQAFGMQTNYKVSLYDVRVSERRNGPRKFPKGHQVTECYLGGWKLPDSDEGTMDTNVKDAVLKVIHATAATEAGQRYEECTDPPYDALADEDGKGVVPDLVQVLQDQTAPRLLFFNGIEDLVCNHVGNERALENLPWFGRDAWIVAERYAWILNPGDKQPAGFIKQYENLLFLKVLNAGHMVPMDIPDISLEMIKTFLLDRTFSKSQQKLDSDTDELPNSCSACGTCPLPIACPKCAPVLHPPKEEGQDNCSKEIAQAKKEALASFTNNDRVKGFAPVAGAILIVVVFLVYGVLEMRKRKRQERGMAVATTTLELQPRYRDEFEEEKQENPSNGVI